MEEVVAAKAMDEKRTVGPAMAIGAAASMERLGLEGLVDCDEEMPSFGGGLAVVSMMSLGGGGGGITSHFTPLINPLVPPRVNKLRIVATTCVRVCARLGSILCFETTEKCVNRLVKFLRLH